MQTIHDLLKLFNDPDYVDSRGISRVSDLHLKTDHSVRIRIDSRLELSAVSEALSGDQIIGMMKEIIPEERFATFDQFKEDFDFGYRWEEAGLNFRINLFRDSNGVAAVIRMLPSQVPAIDSLGFLEPTFWKQLTQINRGLVLVTGTTGSGKSTTISSLLHYINQNKKQRIITLEDPIEFFFKSKQSLFSQRELGTHTNSFAGGLKSALREDPDIIFVGEIRDVETAELALTAAETGHLVVTTLHSRDVAGTFTRLVNMFPADRSGDVASQLSLSLVAIIGQKLLPKKGERGRVPAFEIMINNAATAHLIRKEQFHLIYNALETGSAHGMNTLEQHLVHLFREGEIDRATAIAFANTSYLADQLT